VSAPGGRDRIAYPLDVPTLDDARRAIDAVAGEVGVLKVGLELFVREGPAAVEAARASGAAVFLDLKLHDIPETVARAVDSAARLDVRYLTLHASGGRAMLERAARAAEGAEMTLLAVTVLTSLDDADLRSQGIEDDARAHVLRLGRLATDAGIRGFVTSPAEVLALRHALPTATLVTPGVRPSGGEAHDQKRVATPTDAIRGGADLLVIGRPIRDAPDPAAAARAIAAEIERALEPD
jgi:orotidine-5'-phosphate decarboxylase